jgi:hypothetical protein
VAADGLTGGGVITFGGAGPAGVLDDTWLWNSTGWSKAHTAGSPSPRVGAAAAFDIASHQLVVFGGVGPGGVVLGDTVVLTGQAPVTLGAGPTPTSAPAGSGGPTSAPSSPLSRASVHTPASSPSTTTSPAAAHGSTSAPLIATLHVLHRGDLVKLEGGGFVPGTAIVITFHSAPTLVGRAVADSKGAFTATVGVPTSAAGGTHHFDAAGMTPSGQIADQVATVDVVGVPAPGSSATQRAVLTTIAFSIPAATWAGLVAAGRLRRRRTALS